jgi:hypothetical protein
MVPHVPPGPRSAMGLTSGLHFLWPLRRKPFPFLCYFLSDVENNSYFNYFTEIEEHFCRRRGSVLLVSTLDWALMETWKDAGIPLDAVLRGIDAAFDKYDARPRKSQKINGLAYCSQSVLNAAEEMKEAAVGAARPEPTDTGFEAPNVSEYLNRNADALEKLVRMTTASPTATASSMATASPAPQFPNPASLPAAAVQVVTDAARTLRELAASPPPSLEDLERRLTIMEEKLHAALLTATPDEQLVTVRAEADRELAPYRRKMSGPQIEQLHKQYLQKRLLERYALPRLSLFYI